jgi:hypothetical protein
LWWRASAIPRLMVKQVLPTPPLPLVIAMILGALINPTLFILVFFSLFWAGY